MQAPRPWLVLLLLAAPTSVYAHKHRAEVFIAASNQTGSSLGFHTSFEHTKKTDRGCLRPWSGFGELAVHSDKSRNDYTVMLGFRRTFRDREEECPPDRDHPNRPPERFPQFVPSVQFQPLATQITSRVTSRLGVASRERDAELAASAGAGLDIIFRKQDGIRIQVDLIQRYTGEKKTHFRVSVGAIVRWHPPFLPDSPEHDELRTTPARPAPARPR